jgi:hypothetical protein
LEELEKNDKQTPAEQSLFILKTILQKEDSESNLKNYPHSEKTARIKLYAVQDDRWEVASKVTKHISKTMSKFEFFSNCWTTNFAAICWWNINFQPRKKFQLSVDRPV